MKDFGDYRIQFLQVPASSVWNGMGGTDMQLHDAEPSNTAKDEHNLVDAEAHEQKASCKRHGVGV